MTPFILLLLTLSLAHAQRDALSCREHPRYRPWYNPPLIKSWDMHEAAAPFDRLIYYINFSKYTYRPRGSPSSTKYANLDIFHNSGIFARKGRLSTLYFQRPSRVYMFVGVPRTETRPARVPGWRSEGYADLDHPDKFVEWRFGVYQKSSMAFSPHVYVFSKQVTDKVTLPTKDVVRRAMLPVRALVYFHFLVAEADGKPYAGYKGNLRKRFKPNGACPRELHDAWKVRHSDTRDPDIRGKKWASWHPVWDPCFWCTYGHDHGSSPKHIMGYEPTFTYAAWKNGRENEADEGFKSYVIKYGQHWVYLNIHIQVGQLRRVTARYHTIAIVVIKISSGEKMVEITHKADYGFLSARGKKEAFVPLTRKDLLLKNEMTKKRRVVFRSVNLINPARRDPRLQYRDRMFQGVYEAWHTVPICSRTTPFGGIRVDVRNPSSGIKTVARKEYVKLGLSSEKRNTSLNRLLIIRDVEISAKHCSFKTNGGYFYTNADGSQLFPGPGRGRIRQFIKPGFKIKLSGRFQALNNGLGVYGVMPGMGKFWDHGSGVNPDIN